MDVLECSVRFCVRLVGEKHQHKHRPTIPILSKQMFPERRVIINGLQAREDKGDREGTPIHTLFHIGNSARVIFKTIDPKGD